MPTLSVLQKFRDSFSGIGGEKSDLENRGLPYDELELPDTEAVAAAEQSPQFDELTSPETSSNQGPGDFEFNIPADLLSGLSDELETAATDTSDDIFGEALDEPAGVSEFDVPGMDFLNTGLSDLPDAESPDAGIPGVSAHETDDTGIPDLLDFEFDNAGVSDVPGGEAADADIPDLLDLDLDDAGVSDVSGHKAAGAGLSDQPDFDISAASELDLSSAVPVSGDYNDSKFNFDDTTIDLNDETLDLGSEILPEYESGNDEPDTGSEAAGVIPGGADAEYDTAGEADMGPGAGESFDLGDLDFDAVDLNPGNESTDFSGESSEDFDGELLSLDTDDDNTAPGSGDFDAGTEGFELEGEAPFEMPPLSETGDTPEFAAGAEFDAGTESREGADFSLPGIDDLFSAPLPADTGDSQDGGSEVVEEIRLSDDELDRLNKTLSAYPLNLRIACEELIVEHAVAPNLMSRLIQLLVTGAPARETAALAGEILNRNIRIPRGFQKSTGEAMEAEQASFVYIFIHKFLPVLRLFAVIALAAIVVFFLVYKFIYIPIHAENIYRMGYGRIAAGEYQRANERFATAFGLQQKKIWFYRYAEAFRDERQFLFAEQKYDDLLRYYPRDKKGVLDYAALETWYLRNYDKANELILRQLLDYAPDDFDGLLALGDNALAWGEVDPARYDDARFAFARLLSKYGWRDPIVERMMKYFIRTDNLKEVLPLYDYFTNNAKRKISPDTLAELGGYLLDKQLEVQRGVPNEYVSNIEGVRALLLRAVAADPSLPEAHYHLSRYYNSLGNTEEERKTLENAITAFDNAKGQETIHRLKYRIDAQRRYADVLISTREFFKAGESLVKGVNLYEDALNRRILNRAPDSVFEFGRLYAGLGDLEYFTKSGDWEQALTYYHRAEQNGWAPPEMKYRMGRAYYQTEDWKNALEYFFAASKDLPLNRRLLFALGNASYQRRDYFAAQGYFDRLLDILESERIRLPLLLPNDKPEYLELAERLMMARNNAGVVYEALAEQTGNRSYRSRAMSLYADATSAWDSLTRNPVTMIRSGGIPLPQLNARNLLYPESDYEPQIFTRIDADVLEPSYWEQLLAPGR